MTFNLLSFSYFNLRLLGIGLFTKQKISSIQKKFILYVFLYVCMDYWLQQIKGTIKIIRYKIF